MRTSSRIVADRCPGAGGFRPTANAVMRSSAPVASAAPAMTYNAAIVTGASDENPVNASFASMTSNSSNVVTAPRTTMGALTLSDARTAMVTRITARVNQASHVTSLSSRQPAGLAQVTDHVLDGVLDRPFRRVDDELGVGRHLVRVGHTGERRQVACARSRVQTLAVALLAHFERCRHVHQHEAAVALHHLPYVAPRRVVGRDGRRDRDAAVPRHLRRDIADAADVEVAVL